MKKWFIASALALLDDTSPENTSAFNDDRPWKELTPKEKPVVSKVSFQNTVQTKTSDTKVFSSEKSLSNMMKEYNSKRATSLPPLKSQLIQDQNKNRPPSSTDFKSELVRTLQLPSIPGRVLRPTRKT